MNTLLISRLGVQRTARQAHLAYLHTRMPSVVVKRKLSHTSYIHTRTSFVAKRKLPPVMSTRRVQAFCTASPPPFLSWLKSEARVLVGLALVSSTVLYIWNRYSFRPVTVLLDSWRT